MFPLPVIAEHSWYSLLHVCFALSEVTALIQMVLVHLLRSMRVSITSRSDFFLLLSQCRNSLLMRILSYCIIPSSLHPLSDKDFEVFIIFTPPVQNVSVIVLVELSSAFRVL